MSTGRVISIGFIIILSLWTHVDVYASNYKTVVVDRSINLLSTFSQSNIRYIIKNQLNLNGDEIIIGNNSVLVFDGGSFSNGKIKGNKTVIEAGLIPIFKNVVNTGTFSCDAVYPQWFGAIADGRHDCSKAIQQAIDFSVNNNIVPNPWDIQQIEGNCMKVTLIAGSYLLKNPIYLRDYTHIEGQGRGVSKLINGGIQGGRALIYMGCEIDGKRNKVNNVSISNFSINGDDKNCIGVYSLAQYSFIEKIFITKCKAHGIYSNESWCTYIKNCHFIYNAIDSGGYTICLTGRNVGWGANAVTISECEFLGMEVKGDDNGNPRIFKGNCIFNYGGNGVRIINSTFQQLDTCITLNSSGTGITIENCYFEAVNTPITGVLYGNHITNNFFTAPIYANAIIKSNYMQGCSVMNNTVAAELDDLVLLNESAEDEELLYYGNTFIGNFRSATELSFSGRILEYFMKSKYNLVITNAGKVYGSMNKN